MAGNDLSFLNVVKDLKVNEAVRLLDEMNTPLPHARYVIFFTARSGSSWLTSVLSQTGLLGYPEEYLNPHFVRNVATAVQAVEPEKFLTALQRRRKTPNGVFGVEVRQVDVKLFDAQVFFSVFGDGTKIFNLWRDNIVAQAISLFRAVETKHFHSTSGEKAEVPPAYNAEGIRNWLIHLAAQENANLNILVQNKRAFVNLCYEQIVHSQEATLQLFARQLGVDLPPEKLSVTTEKTLKKIGDDWNKETEQRFRADCADFITKIEMDRQIKPYILARTNGIWMRPARPPAVSPAAQPAPAVRSA